MEFRRHQPGPDEVTPNDLHRLQDNIETFARPLSRRLHLYSELIEDVSLTSGQENLVAHGLGKKVRGFRVTDINASASVWRDDTSTADLTVHIPLRISSTATVSLEVFA
jgi:hypothetical protein